MIKVLITDDHAIVRQGLKQILGETADMTVVGEADTGLKAIRMADSIAADVMLLDIGLPDRSGIEALKQIKKDHPKLAVLMLSMHAEDQYALRAIKAGASGYLNKNSATELLVTAIRKVASGKKYISPALAEELANNILHNDEQPLHQTLSDREFQTLCLIASGRSLTQAAEDLSLSVKTVSVYRARLLEKMNLKNNAELTHYAIKNQLVE